MILGLETFKSCSGFLGESGDGRIELPHTNSEEKMQVSLWKATLADMGLQWVGRGWNRIILVQHLILCIPRGSCIIVAECCSELRTARGGKAQAHACSPHALICYQKKRC